MSVALQLKDPLKLAYVFGEVTIDPLSLKSSSPLSGDTIGVSDEVLQHTFQQLVAFLEHQHLDVLAPALEHLVEDQCLSIGGHTEAEVPLQKQLLGFTLQAHANCGMQATGIDPAMVATEVADKLLEPLDRFASTCILQGIDERLSYENNVQSQARTPGLPLFRLARGFVTSLRS